MKRVGLTLVIVALLAAACGSGDSEVNSASAGCDTPAEPFAGTAFIEVDGMDRNYRIFVPEAGAEPMPVVMSYHAFTQSSAAHQSLSRLEPMAREEGFILVLPQGSHPSDGGPAYFNLGTTDDPQLADDVAFTEALLDSIEADYCVDRTRVYAMGWSNGGMFASTLACRLGDRIAAVAPVAGTLTGGDCVDRPVPVLVTHGTDDPLVPYQTADPDRTADEAAIRGASAGQEAMFAGVDRPVTEYVADWAAGNGCSPEPVERKVSDEVTAFDYSDCDADVVFHVVEGGGHAWPGTPFGDGREFRLGHSTMDIDATTEALAFFEENPLPTEYLK